jgi:CRP/FNR family transcriptional regulator, cyclic AMP receptor protein
MPHPSASRVHPHPCGACVVKGSFCAQPDPLRTIFESLKTSAAYAKGEAVFHETDLCHSVFVVCSGSMKLMTSSSQGKALLLRFAPPGSLLGLAEALIPGGSYQFTAIAAAPSVVAIIPRETFVRFATSYPEVCRRITLALSEQYRMAQQEMKFLVFGGTSTSRLAHLLLDEALEYGQASPDGIHIPSHITHSELAQLIGSTRETVTRALGGLEHGGIIERQPEEIIIHSTRRLARLVTH